MQIIEEVKSQKGRPQKYPWGEWCDGKARRLVYGVDFNAKLKSFRTMVHRKARDLNMRAKTNINLADQSIEIQFESSLPSMQ